MWICSHCRGRLKTNGEDIIFYNDLMETFINQTTDEERRKLIAEYTTLKNLTAENNNLKVQVAGLMNVLNTPQNVTEQEELLIKQGQEKSLNNFLEQKLAESEALVNR